MANLEFQRKIQKSDKQLKPITQIDALGYKVKRDFRNLGINNFKNWKLWQRFLRQKMCLNH